MGRFLVRGLASSPGGWTAPCVLDRSRSGGPMRPGLLACSAISEAQLGVRGASWSWLEVLA